LLLIPLPKSANQAVFKGFPRTDFMNLKLSLLRGVCQTPAYVACEKGFFSHEGINVTAEVAATAWLVPHKLSTDESQFAVMPWSRVAAAEGYPFVLLAGSGCEEAAIVVRNGIEQNEVKKVAIPLRGGIKDLTAMGLIKSLGWNNAELLRMPSGDGAIISFFGQGSDAASMVEPYATMMEELGVGKVLRRTGDLWKGAPGCSLTTTRKFRDQHPEVVSKVVQAFAKGADFVLKNPEESSEIASKYIGISSAIIRKSLEANKPNVDALRNTESMKQIIELMKELGYVEEDSSQYLDLSFLDQVRATKV
jgi:ABC-type nitrate/sulfonate/bicarbonate transport system substrate-binding protein